MLWDFVVYAKEDKHILVIVKDVKEDPKYLIGSDCVGVYLPQCDYHIIEQDDGRAYFENLREKVLYIDEYRGRYDD